MQDLRRHLTTTFGRVDDGGVSKNAQRLDSRSQSPDVIGHRFGKLEVIDDQVIRRGATCYLRIRCTLCGAEGTRSRAALRFGSAGCRPCGSPRRVAKWLYQRANSAKQRCTNPNNKAYPRYGARGISFGFESPLAMALWVQENLGLERDMELDRIDNDRGYEPGNLRYITRIQNLANTRKTRVSAKVHAFKLAHPEIHYSDATLSRMFSTGSTDQEIIDRFHRPSSKPKGVYGIFSTPDPFIASLAKDS